MLIQTICDGQNIYVIEFSARTGGGVKHILINKVSGFDVIRAVVDLTLNEQVYVKKQKAQSEYLNNIFLYCTSGEFEHLKGFEKLKCSGIISDYYLFKSKGTMMTGIANSGDRIAGVTIQANTMHELHDKYKKMAKEISVIDVNGNDILRRDLLDVPQ